MAYKIIPYNPALKEKARELRKNMTPAEVKLWQRLRRKQMLGYDFDRQRPLDSFIVDFFCKELLLAIEIDGESHNWKGVAEKDAQRQRKLESLGVRFLRFTEWQVHQEIEGVLRAIENWILSATS